MADPLTIDAVLTLATKAHASAGALSRPGGLLAGHHERKFVAQIDGLTASLGRVAPAEAAHLAPEQRHRLSESIDGIVADVEAFIATHGATDAKRLERNQHLVKQIYELRRAFESIVRGVAPDPKMVDLRLEMKNEK